MKNTVGGYCAGIGIVLFLAICGVGESWTDTATRALAAIVIIVSTIIGIAMDISEAKTNAVDKKDSAAIAVAVMFIEQGYKIAQRYRIYDPCLLTVHKREVGFEVVLYTLSPYSYIANLRTNDLFIPRNDDGDGCLVKVCNMDIECSWSKFEKEVWNEVKCEHPSWNVQYNNGHGIIKF